MADPTLEEISKAITEDPFINEEARFQRLMNAGDEEWNNLDYSRRLHLTGMLFNYADRLSGIGGFRKVIDINEKIEPNDLSPVHLAQWYYQLGNAHSACANLEVEGKPKFDFFDSDDFVEALGYKRAAVLEEDFEELPAKRVSQTYVNLANILDNTGRLSESLGLYDTALNVYPKFGMALGNRGKTKVDYSRLLFNNHHKHIFLHSAHDDLSKALENPDDLYPETKSIFEQMCEFVSEYSDSKYGIDSKEEDSLGDSEEEIEYRRWVLNNRLFLNPLNDISTDPHVAQDSFHLPNMILPEKDFPYPGMFNQMKQEFVSARYMYYEGINGGGQHFSDKDVLLENTLDYSKYGYRTEQTKTALRLSYSIFDKIGVFLNKYYEVHEVDENDKEPNFDEIWYPDMSYNPQNLHEVFENCSNWSLNALYWMKKDFSQHISERDSHSVEVVAHELRDMRNAAEHDYFKIVTGGRKDTRSEHNAVFQDAVYESMGERELRNATKEMLNLSRAALFYLSFTVHYREESKRDEIDGALGPIQSTSVPHEFKR